MDYEVVQSSVNRLVKRREALLQDLAVVDEELQRESAKLTRIRNISSPLYRLPDELLIHILLICQRNAVPTRKSKSRRPPFQVTASHVSHRWRDVVLSTPLLWNTVSLRINTTHVLSCILLQLEAYLKRSQGCFVDISLRFCDVPEIDPVLFAVTSHSSRWRRLSLFSNSVQHTLIFEQFLSTARTPILEHLTLMIGKYREEVESGSPRQAYPTVQSTILAPGIPLSFVRLAGHAVGCLHPPLSSVTTLHIDGWTRHYITPAQLKQLLESAPQLANLSLNQLYMHHPRDPSAPPQVAALSCLRQLRIRGPCSAPTRLFALIAAPLLETLALHLVESFDAQSAGAGRLTMLHRIELEQCALDEDVLAALMHATPAVTEATIDECVPDVLTLLLPDNPTGVRLWPKLHTLALRELPPADVPFLCDLVFTLKEMRKSDSEDADSDGDSAPGESALRTLCLDRRSRTVLRQRQRLDWIEACINVENCDVPEPWPFGLNYDDPHDAWFN